MKTIKTIINPVGLLFLLLLTGCLDDFIIVGNGITTSEKRLTKNFTGIASSGEFIVHVTHGGSYETLVNAETNVLPYIGTNVRGNTLHIEITGIHALKNHRPIEVFITVPFLDEITLSGSGIITTDYFKTETISLTLSGSGQIETAFDAEKVKSVISGSGLLRVSGSSDNADFYISGSGGIDASNLSVSSCETKISGSGYVRIFVEKFLLADISGTGTIYYTGNPEIESHISGSGKLIKQNR